MYDASALIDAYSQEGYPTDCVEDWTMDSIEVALQRGQQPSDDAVESMKALYDEKREKVANGYYKVIRYGEIKKNLPEKLKISPVAMIPHKSRSYRKNLDLSFQIQHRRTMMQSVNSETVKHAPAELMI